MEKGRIATAIALVSAIVAIAALAYQMASKRTEDRDKEINNWQRTAVYDVLDNKRALDFDSLYNEYLKEIANENYRTHIPPKQSSKQELRKIILSLRADSVIDYDSRRRYYVRQIPEDRTSILFEQFVIQKEQSRAESILMDKLMKESGKTISELYGEIKKESNTN